MNKIKLAFLKIFNRKKTAYGRDIVKNPYKFIKNAEARHKFLEILETAKDYDDEREYLEIFMDSLIDLEKLEAILELMDLIPIPEDFPLEELSYVKED